MDPLGLFSTSFFTHFALTLLIELLVATVAFRGWQKLKQRNLALSLGYVLLANLISYPATWIFWPSLQRFQAMATRYVGLFVAFGTLAFTGLLPLAVLATVWCLLLAALGAGYSGRLVAVPGMPVGLTIALSEVFAVSFEALILYLLARRTLALSARQAAHICFVANMSSFLAGLALASKIGKHRQACRNLTRRRPVCLQAVNLIYWLLTPCAS